MAQLSRRKTRSFLYLKDRRLSGKSFLVAAISLLLIFTFTSYATLKVIIPSADYQRPLIISYTIPNEKSIKRLRQPSDKTCWAAVGTMMWMWKHKKETDIRSMLNQLSNPAFVTYFDGDKAVSSKQKADFLKSMSLKFEFSSSFMPEFLEAKLKAHGPIWVTTHESPDEYFSFVHARICYGISGDGTMTGTTLLLIDPATGTNVIESFDAFIKKYENASGIDIQMVHW